MVGYWRCLCFDIVGIGEWVVGVAIEDRKLVVLVTTMGLADVIGLLV